MTRCKDWREAPRADIEPLVAAEARAWLRQLHWDVGDAWQVIEPARQAGQLPGFLSVDDRLGSTGWTAYLQHGRSLQVMALVASERDATCALVEAIMTSPEARRTDSAVVCVRDTSPGLSDVLRSHGFRVEPYRYMAMSLSDVGEPDDGFEPWRES